MKRYQSIQRFEKLDVDYDKRPNDGQIKGLLSQLYVFKSITPPANDMENNF